MGGDEDKMKIPKCGGGSKWARKDKNQRKRKKRNHPRKGRKKITHFRFISGLEEKVSVNVFT